MVPGEPELLKWLVWREGDEEEDIDERWRWYRQEHLPALRLRMPADLAAFADELVGPELLHDAYLTHFAREADRRWLLRATCRNSRGGGERRLTVLFLEADPLGAPRHALEHEGGGLDYTEFDDAPDGRFEMRVSIWDSTGPSFGVRFSDLSYLVDELPDGSADAVVARRSCRGAPKSRRPRR